MFAYFAEANARLLTGKKIYSIFQGPCQEVVEFIGSDEIFAGGRAILGGGEAPV